MWDMKQDQKDKYQYQNKLKADEQKTNQLHAIFPHWPK